MFLKSIRKKYSIFNNFYIFFREMHLRIYKRINAIQMLIIFIMKPSKLYKYSLNHPDAKDSLPKPGMRYLKELDLYSIFKPFVDYNFDYLKGNINLIFPGFDGKIDYDQINYFLNHKVNNENINSNFITSDIRTYLYYKEKGVEVVYIEATLINKSKAKEIINPIPSKYKNDKKINLYLNTDYNIGYASGSGIACIIGLNLVSQNLNVLGWNCYFKEKLSNLNKFELLRKLFFIKNDHKLHNQIEHRLLNSYFAYKLRKLKSFNLISNLDYFDNTELNKFFTPRLKKIFEI